MDEQSSQSTPLSQKEPHHIHYLPIIIAILVITAGISFAGYKLGQKSLSLKLKSKNQTAVIQDTNKSENIIDLSKWKNITSTGCKVSLQYPPEWKGEEADDEDGGCSFVIEHPSDKTIRFILINYPGLLWDSYKATITGMPIKLGSADMFRVETVKKTNMLMVSLIIHNNNLLLNGGYEIKANDMKTKLQLEKIIQSIQLNGTNEYYQTFQTQKLNKMQQSINQMNDNPIKISVSNLQSILTAYKQNKGSYPLVLEDLKSYTSSFSDKDYSNPITNEKYSYVSNGASYTISTKLSNGDAYSVFQ